MKHTKIPKDNLTETKIPKDNLSKIPIPKHIYGTFYGKNGDPLPEPILKNIEFIESQNPDWTYHLYRDDDVEDFILKYYGKTNLNLYLSINKDYGAARADFFRYLLINQKGGVYLDIKSAPKIPLNEIIKPNDQFIFSHWKKPVHAKLLNYPLGELQNWFIISIPKHPFLKEVIKNVIYNIKNYNPKLDGIGKSGVLKLTGPIVYSQSIIPLLSKYRHTGYKTNTLAGLQYVKIPNYKKTIFKDNHYSIKKTPIIINR